MGQRLAIQVTENKEVLASAYYHWMGYAIKSAFITQEAIHEYIHYLKGHSFYDNHKKDAIYKAVRMLASVGIGVDNNDFINFKKSYPDSDIKKSLKLDDGVIYILKDISKAGEAVINIDISTETVSFDAFYKTDYKTWYNESSKKMITCFWNDNDKIIVSNSEEIQNDINKITSMYEQKLITKETKEYIADSLKEGNCKLKKHPIPLELDNFPDLSKIKFEDFWKLKDLIKRANNSDNPYLYYYSEPDTIYSLM